MSKRKRKVPTNTSQEGVTPVQSFTCRPIPVSAGVPLEARRGRPLRKPAERTQDQGDGAAPSSQTNAADEKGTGAVSDNKAEKNDS